MSNERPKKGGMGGGFGPGHGGMGAGEKAKDFKKSVTKLAIYMKRYFPALILVFLFATGSTIFTIVGPTILGDATTEIFNGLVAKIYGTGGIDFDKIGTMLFQLICLYGISLFLGMIQGYIMTNISNRVTYNLRKDISEKINRMPMNYFESRTTGEILSRVTNDIDTLGNGLTQSVSQVITSVTMVIGVIIMMVRIHLGMTGAAVAVIPLSMILIVSVIKMSQKHFKNQQKYLGDINGQIEEVYSGHNIVKVFNKEASVLDDFTKNNEKLYESAWKSQALSGLMMPIMIFVGNIGYVIISILGGILAANGTIEVGQIQSFIQYSRSLNQPIQQLTQIANQLQSTAASAERVFEFLEESEEEQVVDNPVDITDLKGNVEFKNVKFGYSEDKIIINDFSAKVTEGQRIAIVGPTGAGKTTMVKLLMRFYDVNQGAILVDGHNLKDFNRSDLRDMFGMVLQDTWLFNGTISDNIRYGKLDATEEEVEAAAKAAHAHHFISTQPEGYKMVLNEETSNISQGQKQLLTIARAILSDPKILILDEATSSVDTRTEMRIQRAMHNLMKNRTSFIIAHRLSTIKDADLILVMRDGDIVEQGNHEELMFQGGFYKELYNSQFEEAV